jgi:iduronate 2-sulfatase
MTSTLDARANFFVAVGVNRNFLSVSVHNNHEPAASQCPRQCFFVVAVLELVDMRLNVLLLISDDLRPDLGIYGGPAITPNLDRLANSSGTVRFTRAYVQQAICCPSRSSLLLGRRPDTTRVWDLKTQFRETAGASSWKTLPQLFKDRGYVTIGMGKIFHPLKWNGTEDDRPSWTNGSYFQPAGGIDVERPLSTINCSSPESTQDDTMYSDGKTVAHAVEVLRNASLASAPFFVAVGLHRPHLPWVSPSKYFTLYRDVALADHRAPPRGYNATGARGYSWDPQSGPRHCQPLYNQTYKGSTPALPEYGLVDDATARSFRRGYWAAVSQTDRNVGVVLDELETLSLRDSTLVCFLGDHGWQLGDLGEFGKKTNFERATRAPLIIRDPRSRHAPAASAALVEFVDIMPTLAELALGGGSLTIPTCPTDSTGVALCTEGRSLAPIMADPAGTTHSRRAAFMQYAACMHDDKVWHDACAADDEPRVMGYAIRTRRWRYVEWVGFEKATTPPTPRWDRVFGTELYDHTDGDSVENAAEATNVVAEPALASVVAGLSRQLRRGWRARAV